jgi:hypothetical protein
MGTELEARLGPTQQIRQQALAFLDRLSAQIGRLVQDAVECPRTSAGAQFHRFRPTRHSRLKTL